MSQHRKCLKTLKVFSNTLQKNTTEILMQNLSYHSVPSSFSLQPSSCSQSSCLFPPHFSPLSLPTVFSVCSFMLPVLLSLLPLLLLFFSVYFFFFTSFPYCISFSPFQSFYPSAFLSVYFPLFLSDFLFFLLPFGFSCFLSFLPVLPSSFFPAQ